MSKKQNIDNLPIFSYNDLFEAFIAGDTEGLRTGDSIDFSDFNEWLVKNFNKHDNDKKI